MTMRWDPFGETTTLQQAMNQLLQDSVVLPRQGAAGMGTFAVALDVLEEENAYRVTASLPGMKPEDVQINLQNNVLTIAGEIKDQREQQGRYHLVERRTGRFSRSIALPVAVDAEGAEADFEHGVLTLTLPKAEQARRKQIPVRSQGTTAIEGEPAQPQLNTGGTKGKAQSTGQQPNGQREPAPAGAS